MIMNALSGKPLPVYGDGSNVRDWIYVEDHCKAVRLAFEKGRPGEVYAIGANNEQKNLNLVNEICSILDDVAPPVEIPDLPERGLQSYKDLIRFVTDRPGHVSGGGCVGKLSHGLSSFAQRRADAAALRAGHKKARSDPPGRVPHNYDDGLNTQEW